MIRRWIIGYTVIAALLYAEDSSRVGYYTSPDATARLVKSHRSFDLKTWKKSLQSRFGLELGGDYQLVGMEATEAIKKAQSLGGALRLYGTWTLWRDTNDDSGALVFKIEHRHALNGVSPVDFAGEVGYAGLFHSTMSDQGARLTTLYWKQTFGDRNGVIYAGFLDVSEYVDVYLLISPWNAFTNMVFATGSATIGGLPDGALGVMAAGWLTDHVYLVGGIADADADAHRPFKGFDRILNDFRTFKTVEIGWTTGKESLFFDSIHLTFWHLDTRPRTGGSEGWGRQCRGCIRLILTRWSLYAAECRTTAVRCFPSRLASERVMSFPIAKTCWGLD